MTSRCAGRPVIDQSSIHHAAEYLRRACASDGRFNYRVNLDPAVDLKPKYNVLRHAGAIYALAMHYDRYPDVRTVDVLIRASRFLKDECLAPIEGIPDHLGVWSRPELNGSGRRPQVKLGGVGLGLVALVAVEAAVAGSTSLDDLRGLGRMIEWLQKDDGSFYSKYIPSTIGRRDKWTSLYYPGEAALGLLMLDRHDPAERWRRCAARALGYLARSRAGEQNVPADHWALLATAQLLPVLEECDESVSRSALIGHAVQICESILREQVWDADDPRLDGGFAPDGRTTPTATRLEGLLAALTFLPETDGDLRARVGSAVEHGTSFLLRAQVHEGQCAGGFPRAVRRFPDTDPRNVRSFNDRATEVRIDYVQHALCAMMQYRGWAPGPA